MSSWKEEEISETEHGLQKEVLEHREELEEIWITVKEVLDEYPLQFPPEK